MATLFSIAKYRRDGGKPDRRRRGETPVVISGTPENDPGHSLASLTAQHYRRWQPSSVEERLLVDLLIFSDWQLRRLKAVRQSRPPEPA